MLFKIIMITIENQKCGIDESKVTYSILSNNEYKWPSITIKISNNFWFRKTNSLPSDKEEMLNYILKFGEKLIEKMIKNKQIKNSREYNEYTKPKIFRVTNSTSQENEIAISFSDFEH